MKINKKSFLFTIILVGSLFIASFFLMVACDEQLLKEVNTDKSDDCVVTTNIYPNIVANFNVNSVVIVTNTFTTNIVTNCGEMSSSSGVLVGSSSSETIEKPNDCGIIEKSTDNYSNWFLCSRG